MGKIADATFEGKVGSYRFAVYPADTTFKAVGAVYVFSKRTVGSGGKGTHGLLYIGETDSLADRIPNHEKWPCAKRNGATCVCVHLDESQSSRLEKEADLRAAHSTPCNDQ